MKLGFQKQIEAAGPRKLKFISYAFPIVSLLMLLIIQISGTADGSGSIKLFYGVLVWNAVFGLLFFQYLARRSGKKVEE